MAPSLPWNAGSRSGFPTIRLERHSNIIARPEPLYPPNGIRMVASFGSVVGFPSLSRAHPSGIETPLSIARVSFPPAATLVAMSSRSGRCRFPGTAMAIGLLCSPAARAPCGAMFGGLHTSAMPAMPSRAAISE